MKETYLKKLHTTFQKRPNYEDSKKISNCQGLVGKEGWKAEYRGFLGQWIYSAWYYNGGYMLLYICQDP